MLNLDEAESSFARSKGPVTPAFEDDYTFDARWWTGPTNKIQHRLAQVTNSTQELAVIVTTGAFCPVHQGHVQMLETAKRELESRGMAVLGGYICPDHDRYVSTKIKVNAVSAAERLELCELAVEDSDWLMVDRWAAQYASSAVSFTSIVGHIEKMVNYHVKSPKPIKVVYAFGGDNAMFAFSFVAKWACVCVLRPGSLNFFKEMLDYESLRKNPRIIFSHDTTAPLDSTSIRKGDLSGLLPKVRDRWFIMTTGNMSQKKTSSGLLEATNYHIRNEGAWAFKPFLHRPTGSIKDIETAYDTFCDGLKQAFELAFEATEATTSPYKILSTRLAEQQEKLEEFLASHGNIISLDPCLSGTHDLHISEVQEQLVQGGATIVASPGSAPLDQQLELVTAGTYALLAEDLPLNDNVREFVIGNLPADRAISQHLSMVNSGSSRNKASGADRFVAHSVTMNARDFLAGSHQGGALTQLPSKENTLVRVPNVLPYFQPPNVGSAAQMGFSKAVWELNLQFFNATEPELLVRDTDSEFQAFCEIQGFPPEMRMTDICQWHLDAFADMTFKELWIGL